jgi:hypothetical protein
MPNAAAAGLPNPGSYTVNANGTVKDNVTGLVWQQGLDTRTYTWQGEQTYCANLTLAGGGWHLLTRIELVSIVDLTRRDPAIDTTAFPGIECSITSIIGSEWIWSSSVVLGGYGGVWAVNCKQRQQQVQSRVLGSLCVLITGLFLLTF